MENNKRTSFSGSIGFVLAAAGSAVGLGNIWRFPYLAAKDGGGLFLVIYVVLALTFGFTLLTTEIAIGRKTKQSPLTAYEKVHPKFKWIGTLACIVPMLIIPYYGAIGGWVVKYFVAFCTGGASKAASDGYFTGFITAPVEPVIYMFIFLLATSFIIYLGVDKGIEKVSKILMPVLVVLVIGIAVFSLTITHTDETGTVRTGMEGLKIYLIPSLEGKTIKDVFIVVMDAMGQLFYSLSIAMGIMVAYGSYVRDDDNLMRSINQIEIFDTAVAFFAGVMIIPAVFAFMGSEGLTSSGPGLMFISLPKVFDEMGGVGTVIGIIFFISVIFAALTSCISIMEAIVSSFMDRFNMSRKKATIIEGLIAIGVGVIVCLGYNALYFEVPLPNGATAQILDIMDYLSNNILMPVVAISTCILIGWVVKSSYVIDEVTKTGAKFGRKQLYKVMIRFIAPVLLVILLLEALGII
ncbi:MAG: sodium-dependent transporter [Lachnospiraceae bacterium]|nr:sodium-dependent transporter [Lachnospiraceae bacterium]